MTRLIYVFSFCVLLIAHSFAESTMNHNGSSDIEVPFSSSKDFSEDAINFCFDLTDKDGNRHKINGNGKVTVIMLTTTWCNCCPAILKKLERCKDKLINEKNIEIVSIIVGNDNINDIQTHYTNSDIKSFKVFKAIPQSKLPALNCVPTCIVLDKTGKQVFRYSGHANYDGKEFLQFLKDLEKKTC